MPYDSPSCLQEQQQQVGLTSADTILSFSQALCAYTFTDSEGQMKVTGWQSLSVPSAKLNKRPMPFQVHFCLQPLFFFGLNCTMPARPACPLPCTLRSPSPMNSRVHMPLVGRSVGAALAGLVLQLQRNLRAATSRGRAVLCTTSLQDYHSESGELMVKTPRQGKFTTAEIAVRTRAPHLQAAPAPASLTSL